MPVHQVSFLLRFKWMKVPNLSACHAEVLTCFSVILLFKLQTGCLAPKHLQLGSPSVQIHLYVCIF